VEFLELVNGADLVLTDSGTVVEETSVLGIPTIQMRHSTERPEVYDTGGCIKFDPSLRYGIAEFSQAMDEGLSRRHLNWTHNLGDGKASERIVWDILQRFSSPESFKGHDVRLTKKPYRRNFGAGFSERGTWRSAAL
jgi:UDP-N-acetylglucosamine 2-epimerase (non-hydrolysing)